MSITDAPARSGWPDRPGHEGKTRLELHDLVEGRAMLIRSREIAFERQVDKARVEPRQLLITAAEPLHRAGAVIFQHHIRPYRKVVDHRLPFLALEVDCKAALVAVEGSEETGAEPAEATGMVTVGRGLDLDHVGAELGEDEPGGNSIKKEGTPILFDRVKKLASAAGVQRRNNRSSGDAKKALRSRNSH